jgi:hypothetical protein
VLVRKPVMRVWFDTTAATNVGVFTRGQKQFLDFHRAAVLLQSDPRLITTLV